MYVGDIPGTKGTIFCGHDDISAESGGTISAVGCQCLILGSVVTVDLEETTAMHAAVITRIAVFGLPKDGVPDVGSGRELAPGEMPPQDDQPTYTASPTCTF